MRIGAIVQARLSSTRLPGKILRSLPYGSDKTVLDQVILRLKRSRKLDVVIVATTNKRCDDGIVRIAKRKRVKYFRGDENDILSRYYLSAREHGLDIIVRITSDCPCVDSEIVDFVIGKHLSSKSDYTSTTLKRTFPRGLDVEVFNMKALKIANKEAKKDYEREHVTPYFYMNPRRFKIVHAKASAGLRAPGIRITLDTIEDYALLCAVFSYLYPKNRYFTTCDIINLFNEKPWLRLINCNVIQKKVTES